MVREKTVSEQLDENNKLLQQLIDEKKFPGEKKVRFKKPSKSKIKKGYVIVQLIRNNNHVDFRKLPVISNNIQLKDNKTYHLADTEYIGMYKKYPIVMIPEWSNEPITKETLTRSVDKNKSTIKPQKQIIHLMEDARLAEMEKEKRSSRGLLIIIGLGIVGYLIGSQLGWFG